MSTSDFLFQSSIPSSFTNTLEARQDMPEWYQASRRQLITRASQIAAEPYQAYQGQRLAGFNTDQQAAFDKTREAANRGNPYLAEAAGNIRQGAQGFNQQKFDSYMNPYRNDMMGELSRQASRNLSENLLPQVGDTFTGAGMFGSSRHADFANRAVRDTQESLLGRQAEVLNSAYGSAMDNMNTDLSRTMQSGQNLGALGQIEFNQNLANASSLETIGNRQQEQQQRSLDLAYGDFATQRDAPLKNLELMSGTINGYAPNATSYQYQPVSLPQNQYQPSALTQLMGAVR
jgi:hypothetical protein